MENRTSEKGDVVFRNWPWSLSGYIQDRLLPDDEAFCRDGDDTRESVRQMRADWTRHLDRGQDDHQILRRADDRLNEQLDCYVERYVDIWSANAETILHATLNHHRVGLTVVLPVTTESYEALRDGKISFLEIKGKDILPQSQNLILDSAVEFTSAPSTSPNQLANSLSYALFYQIAALSTAPQRADFRMLSFAASSTNIQRLTNIGFVQRDAVMPVFDYQLCEFNADNRDLPLGFVETRESISFFAHMFRRWVSSEASFRRKRKMILAALGVYRKLALPTYKSKSHAKNAAA